MNLTKQKLDHEIEMFDNLVGVATNV